MTEQKNDDLAKELAIHASAWRDTKAFVSEDKHYVTMHDDNIAAMQSLLERAARALGYTGEFK